MNNIYLLRQNFLLNKNNIKIQNNLDKNRTFAT